MHFRVNKEERIIVTGRYLKGVTFDQNFEY